MPTFEYRCHIAFVTQHSVKLFNWHLGGNSFNLAANRAKGQAVKIASVYRTCSKGKDKVIGSNNFFILNAI